MGALVSPDGSVFWSRPGLLRPLCRFDGLWNFPWGKLSCQVEFGAWVLNGNEQNIIPMKSDDGISWSGKEGSDISPTQGSRFQEYELNAITLQRVVTMYGAIPY